MKLYLFYFKDNDAEWVEPVIAYSAREARKLVPTGTIDAGYRGEIGIIIYNLSKNPYIINKYDKIAQLIISPVYSPKIGFEEVELLEKTERNQAGFGSTGK